MAAPAGLGINFAHDFNCYNDNAECIRQLTELKALGITKIRVNIPTYQVQDFNPSFRNQLRLVCATALSMGFYVIWGYNAFPLTAANQAAFKQANRDGAAWAQSVGLSEWCVGNEEDLTTTLTQAQLRAVLQDVCQTIKVTDGFSGVVSTGITTNVYAAWALEVSTWSMYMKLNLHIYGTLAASASHFDHYARLSRNELGDNVYVGEYGVDTGRLAFTNDTAWVNEIVRRTNVLINAGHTSYYYFAYSIQGDADEEKRWSAYRVTDAMPTPLLKRLGRQRQNVVSWPLTSTTSTLRYIEDSKRDVRDFGTSLNFPGSTGEVMIGTGNPFSSSFYVSAWVNWKGTNGNFHTIFVKRDFYLLNQQMFSLSINTSGVLAIDTIASFASFGYTFPLNTWTHIIWEHNVENSTDKLYVNGDLYSTQGIVTMGGKTTAALTIGSTQSGDYLNGKLDEIVVSNITSALTANDAFNMYRKYVYPGTVYRYFKFDEGSGSTAIDSSSNGVNASITGATYSDDVAMTSRNAATNRMIVRDFGTSMSFAADADYVNLGDNFTLAHNGIMCVSVWIKANTFNNAIFGKQRGVTGFDGYLFDIASSKFRFAYVHTLNTNAYIAETVSSFNNLLGKWIHLGLVYNNKNFSVYVNGVAYSTQTTLNNLTTTTTSTAVANIGNRNNSEGNNLHFNGLIDDLRIFTGTVVTANQFEDIRLRGTNPSGETLAGWYKFDEGSGSSATDSSGNGISGTITGATYSSDVVMTERTAA